MDAVAFTIFGLQVHWYGLIIAVALIAAITLACFIGKYRDFSKDLPFELILWIFPFAIVGARLYFLIFNGGPWGLKAFAIWDGGIAIYGAIIGGAIGALIYCLVRKQNFFKLADMVVPCLVLGQGIGRWGCYFSQCCYGVEVTNESLQHFPFALLIGGEWHYATMIFESVCDIIICVALVLMLRKIKTTGVIFSCYLIFYGTIRAIIEGFRGESLMIGSFRVSQVLSIILVAVGIGLLIWFLVKEKRKPKKIKIQTT